ncbi:MAG: DNA polymerase III [Parcubacteria group bacterium GW2011_GWA2_38_13b]|nr:MAG: DNA polymerase III [Parcubacteria group bacterium GW2011_GWA2_38_13b]
MLNEKISKILLNFALYLDMEDEQFRPRAFERAGRIIGAMETDIAEIYKKEGIGGLEKIPEVGKGIAGRIEEFIKTGRISDYEKIKKKMPVDVEGLAAIEGIGPKMIKTLYKHLKIKNVAELEKAARAGKISKIPHFKKKTEDNILKGIEFLKQCSGRFVLGFVLPFIREIEARFQKLPEVKKAVVAGSVRRMKETVGDIDILIVSEKPQKIMDFFVGMPEVVRVYGRGRAKSMVRLENGMDADLRVVKEKSFGATLNYFTGNKEYNIGLRQIAKDKGFKLNEYGLYKGNKIVAGKTEEEIYEKLGLNYIKPELRENNGEIEAAGNGRLPKLIEYGDLKGDLQIQTNWSDGANSIEEMAKEAMKSGLEYIVITDHTKSLAMTGGSDEKKLMRQIKEIDKINQKFQVSSFKFRVLKGAEVNIMKDGSLDISDDVLAKLDVVGAAVHSNFNMPKKAMTERIIRAMRNPNIDIIFHPTGRVINKRPGYEIDIEAIIKAALETGTILEIDAFPTRLDFNDHYIKKCIDAGVKMAIDSDAHHISHLRYLDLGVAQARRGWAKKSDIVNTLPVEEFLKQLK